jgi:hypothetical protein
MNSSEERKSLLQQLLGGFGLAARAAAGLVAHWLAMSGS